MFIMAFSASSDVSPKLPQPVAKKYYKLWFENNTPPKSVHSELKWWPDLKNIYQKNGYNPIWLDGFTLNTSGELLRTLIWETISDGQQLTGYHYEIIESKLNMANHHPRNLTALDLILTDAFLSFTKDSLSGKLTPDRDDAAHSNLSKVKLKSQPQIQRLDVLAVLENYITQNNIGQFLQNLSPQHQGYLQMRATLARYLRLSIEHPWLPIPQGPTLSLGQRHEQVFLLRKRLILLGDLKQSLPQEPQISAQQTISYKPSQNASNKHSLAFEKGKNKDKDVINTKLQAIEAELVKIDPLQHSVYLYDYEVQQAVKTFQNRHSLDNSGVLDSSTRALLNIPIKQRAKQLALNMKRWRHLPPNLGERYIFVNMANFDLAYIEHERKMASMKVIIGKPYRRTPIMSGKIDTVVINPYWNVPYRIAVKDILPKLKKDPSYLQSHQLEVLPNWNNDATTIDTAEIDWKTQSSRNFKYRFRQPPGPNNSLGNVKFLFPNDYSIYLHDTPKRNLFSESQRTLSSGCIRVEKPVELASLVLNSQRGWDQQSIETRINQRKNTHIRLQEPVPVYLMYWTAWVSKDGDVHFRDDFYDRDEIPTSAAQLELSQQPSSQRQRLSI